MGNAAIKQTLEYIEAGDFPADISARDLGLAEFAENTGLPIIKMMYEAFSGSLDAAKALHEALLSGFGWCIPANDWTPNSVAVNSNKWRSADDEDDSGFPAYKGISSGNPARAWLIAILRALDDTEQHEGGSNG